VEFGRFKDIENADTRLTPDPPETWRLLRAAAAPGDPAGPDAPPRLRIGAARWGVSEWVGTLYPPGTPTGEYLGHYARRFGAVELNATYYQVPSPEGLKRWCELVPPGFRFCPKLPRNVSQRRRLSEELASTEAFAERIRSLGEKLGICFLQLPPYFGPASVTELRQYLLKLPADLPLAVELRHPGWFHDPSFRETFAFLAGRGIGAVITDTLGRRDAVHMRLTTPRAFVRFVGNDLHDSDYRRVDDWVTRLGTWFEQGLKEAYFFIHQPNEAHTLTLAEYLDRAVQERLPGLLHAT